MAILILLAIACVFTVAGGLSAVIYTDAVQAGRTTHWSSHHCGAFTTFSLQTVIMVIGAMVVVAIGFGETGGYDNMVENYFNATAANRN